MTKGSSDSALKLDDFLNPKSMITPGAASVLVIIMVMPPAAQFAGLPGNWTALALSFMFGALTFMYGAALVPRVVYFVINSLIIFVMAQGSNALGMSTVRQASAGTVQIGSARETGGANYSVAAAPSGQATPSSTPAASGAPREGTQVAQQQQSTDKKDGFFKPWGWSGDKKP